MQFVRRYGWRAYALSILGVITVVALVHDTPGSAAARTTSAQGTAQSAAGSTQSRPPPISVSPGDDAISCASNTYQQLVLVSISEQHLWACEGGKQVNSSAVTTGRNADDDQTPLGAWRVQAKQRDRYLVGPGYRDYVQYWVPFNGDFGLHDASWQTIPFGSQNYPQDGSHGCVHLPTSTMAWLYRWASVGATVVTVES